MRELNKRVARLEDATSSVATNAVVGAVDRPPRETREQWISRRAGELGVTPASLGGTGESAPPPGVNAYGETWGQWIARRHTELNISQAEQQA